MRMQSAVPTHHFYYIFMSFVMSLETQLTTFIQLLEHPRTQAISTFRFGSNDQEQLSNSVCFREPDHVVSPTWLSSGKCGLLEAPQHWVPCSHGNTLHLQQDFPASFGGGFMLYSIPKPTQIRCGAQWQARHHIFSNLLRGKYIYIYIHMYI